MREVKKDIRDETPEEHEERKALEAENNMQRRGRSVSEVSHG